MRLRLRHGYSWLGEGYAEGFVFSRRALFLLGLMSISIIVFVSSSVTISNPFYALFGPLIGAAPPSSTTDGPLAHVINGTYMGVHDLYHNQDYFLGIPYARPPTAHRRFRKPEGLTTTWSGVRNAVEYSNSCWSAKSGQSDQNDDGTAFDENCLFLNIVRPATESSQNMPVAVWFHGGGFRLQKPIPSQFNLTALVDNSVSIGKPVIAISFNYRLTGWGFLASREMGDDTNLALRDQRMALQWIHENIGAFGGDPSKVTLFGVSAGASSIGFQSLAYGGRNDNLFRGVIMQSGAPIPMLTMGPNRTRNAQTVFDRIAAQVGCGAHPEKMICLRDIPARQLNDAFNNAGGWFPSIDSDFIKDFPSKQMAEGHFVHVPTILGATTDEGSMFAAANVENDQDFIDFVQNSVSRAPGAVLSTTLTDMIVRAYPDDPCIGTPAHLGCSRPSGRFGYQYRRSASYAGDVVIIANRRLTCELWSKSSVPTWSYRFNAHSLSSPDDDLYGVSHFEDVAFVFDNREAIFDYMYKMRPQRSTSATDSEISAFLNLAKFMSNSWVSFVHDQDPNSFRRSDSLTALWPSYDLTNPQNFVFDLNGSYPEPDNFRADPILLLNGANDEYQR